MSSTLSWDEDDVVAYALPSCQYVHNMPGCGRLCVDESDAGERNVTTWSAVGESVGWFNEECPALREVVLYVQAKSCTSLRRA